MSTGNILPSDRHGAAKAWIAKELRLIGAGEEQITQVHAAMDRLQNKADQITETRLSTKLQGVVKPEDSQNEIQLEELASNAFDALQDFNNLYRLHSEGFYETARLPKSLLQKEHLDDYVQAAEQSKDNAKSRLDFLTDQQTPVGNDPNTFICLLASSGTGKTQLAATASLTYNQATTIYLNMGTADSQRFYRPHLLSGSDFLKDSIKIFLKFYGSHGQVTANKISSWASKIDNGTYLFVRVLYHLLTGEPFVPTIPTLGSRMKLKELKDSIKPNKYLVFLDEVPPQGDDEYTTVLCLRDIFRYLGIAPILMSTHTGVQDYAGKTSRVSLDVWTWVVSTLPKFEPFPSRPPVFLVETERPLVLQYAIQELAEKRTLPEIVQGLQRTLQKKKLDAWTTSPSLQLVQLFSADVDINGESFTSSHNLVGHHFGCLLQDREGSKDGIRRYNCAEAEVFGQHLFVAPVSAAQEPLLYLALVTWDESMLPGERRKDQLLFPLTDKSGRALTVRAAFERCSNDFTSNASTDNPRAMKADGNLLEVLVHASLTLASMKTTPGDHNKYLSGVHLKSFIPLVRTLMLDQHLQGLPPVPQVFNDLVFEWPTVPALGGSEPGLAKELGQVCGANLGYLERPEDSAMTDGFISYLGCEDKGSGGPFISIECKNLSNGVDSAVLKKAFQRVQGGIQCALVFVSHIQQGAFQQTTLATVKSECFSNHDADSVSVLEWNRDKGEPSFLKMKGETFAATEKTSLLVVIISVGVIDACISRKKPRLASTNCDYSA